MMTPAPSTEPPRIRATPAANPVALILVGAAGWLVMVTGLAAWVWTGEWRYAVTGLLVALTLGSITGTVTRLRAARAARDEAAADAQVIARAKAVLSGHPTGRRLDREPGPLFRPTGDDDGAGA